VTPAELLATLINMVVSYYSLEFVQRDLPSKKTKKRKQHQSSPLLLLRTRTYL
jgi:hypothetical protein